MGANTQTLDRGEILVYLNRIEDATHSAPTGKLALFVDALFAERISGGEMADGLRGCLRGWTGMGFPPLARIIAWARPQAVNQPRSDAHPVWDPPKVSPVQKALDARAALRKCLDVYRRQNRPVHTLAALERDIAKLDLEIQNRETLARETEGMSDEDAAAYGIEFWGGAKHMPNILVMLRARDGDRNMRGAELWQGQL